MTTHNRLHNTEHTTGGDKIATGSPDGTKFLRDDFAWATPSGGGGGALALIASTTLGADTATFDFSSIPNTYSHLLLKLMGRSDKAAANDDITLRFNNDSGGNYDMAHFVDQLYTNNSQTAGIIGSIAAANSTSNVADSMSIDIVGYALTTFWKVAQATSSLRTALSTYWPGYAEIYWRDTSAINRVTVGLLGAGAKFKAGSICSLYGLS